MKNKIIALLFITSLAFAPSCKKTETAKRDYSALAQYSQPKTLQGINDTTAQILFDTVSNIRTQFLNQLETAYPGLTSTMAADWKTITETTDSATKRTLLQNFDNSYHDKVLLVWNNSGISITDITARYQSVLGNIPFTVGEFGQITMNNVAPYEFTEPVYPHDSTVQFATSEFRTQGSGCVLIGASSIFNLPNATAVSVVQAVLGVCGAFSESGSTIELPHDIYKYLTASFKMANIHMECSAGAFGGASWAKAKLLTNIIYDNGVAYNSRDQILISATSPIIWYAHNENTVPAGAIMTIAYWSPNYSTLPATEPFHPCTSTDNQVLTVGVSYCDSHSLVVKEETTIRMSK